MSGTRRAFTQLRKQLFNLLLFALLLVNFMGWGLVLERREQRLELTFLNVGQGDAILIETPDRVRMLVDAGKDDSGVVALAGKLRPWQGIDVLMLSHPDGDHVGNMAHILKRYDVDSALYEPVEHDNEAYGNFKTAVAELGVEVVDPAAGEIYRLGCCVKFEILWPQRQAEGLEPNDTSIAFLLTYGEFELLSLGDLSTEYEIGIVKKRGIGSVDLLKVSHHGSKTSTSAEFVAQVLPTTSVIQVGKGNSYGHPRPEVLAALANFDSAVYRNDVHGQVTYSTDGFSYQVTTQW